MHLGHVDDTNRVPKSLRQVHLPPKPERFNLKSQNVTVALTEVGCYVDGVETLTDRPHDYLVFLGTKSYDVMSIG